MMSIALLQMTLCVVTAIQMTSSQPTYDVIQLYNDVNTCANEQVLGQLQRDVAELKAAVVRTHATGCPDKFTYISSVNGCYKLVNRMMNWTAAGLACRSLHRDAHLLVINDVQEQLAVGGLLAPSRGSVSFWTAGQRIDPSSESEFVWRVRSTVSAMTYTNWHPGEPSYSTQSESCINFWSYHSFTWNDVACSATHNYPVCELDV